MALIRQKNQDYSNEVNIRAPNIQKTEGGATAIGNAAFIVTTCRKRTAIRQIR